MKSLLGSLLILLLVFSCQKKEIEKIDVSQVEVAFKVDRFDIDFYTTDESDLPSLKQKYNMLFPVGTPDSVWIAKMKNKDELHLYKEAQKVFGNLENEQEQLVQLFKHIKYYNPKFKAPNVITHISGLDYEYPVIYADSLLFVALDMYLGPDNEVYEGFPKYLSQNYRKERLIVDVANDIIDKNYVKRPLRIFLHKMIEEGKYVYLAHRFLPQVSERTLMGYSEEKMQWVIDNEIDVWKYFIENKLLYSNDSKLNARFLDTAPFSKFYQESDQDSPGKIGVWIGYEIVQSYMQNNDVDLQQLLVISPEEIFKKSKYKPRK